MTGRPSRYTAEIAAEICERLAAGESLNAICRDQHMPSRKVVHEWVAADRNGFRYNYARACAMQADLMADEIIEIADEARNDWVMRDGRRVFDRENINRARLRIDARKWLMARLAPKKWGNRSVIRSYDHATNTPRSGSEAAHPMLGDDP